MLREFKYDPSKSHLIDVLSRFNLDFDSEKSRIDVLKFETLSPDSFMWKLLIENVIYYLYAEDYISSLDYVKNQINDYSGRDDWDFVIPRQVTAFESASPVQGAVVYQKPERAHRFVGHAVDSGHDFVFLAKTLEDPLEAQFSSFKTN